MSVHTALLAVSVIGSDAIFNMIKSDSSLNPAEKHATIYQLFNVHLDLALDEVLDLGLELINEIKNGGDSDWTKQGYALDFFGMNIIQGLISKPIFIDWNPTVEDDIWSTDFSNMNLVTIVEGVLLVLGGWQMSFLFDTGFATISRVATLINKIKTKTPFNIGDELKQIVKIMTLGVDKDSQLQTFDFGYEKFLFGVLLNFYHYTLMYYWGHSIGRL